MAELLAYPRARARRRPDAVRVESEERDGALVLLPARRAGRRRQGDRPRRADRARAAHGRAREPPSATAAACWSRSPVDRRRAASLVGRVGRPHGLDGAFFVEDAERGRALVRAGRAAARRRRARPRSSSPGAAPAAGRVIRLDRAVARGTPLEVPREALPADRRGRVLRLRARRARGRRGGRARPRPRRRRRTRASRTTRSSSTSGLLLPLVGGVYPRHRPRGWTYPCRARLLRPRLTPLQLDVFTLVPHAYRLADRAASGRGRARRRARPAPLLVPRHDAAAARAGRRRALRRRRRDGAPRRRRRGRPRRRLRRPARATASSR